MRIYYLRLFIDTADVTWIMGPMFIWSAIEPSMGIVSACLPHLGPLRRLIRNKVASSWGSGAKSGSVKPGSAPWRSGSHHHHHHHHHHHPNSQVSGGLATVGGGLRYSLRGDRKMLKLTESDDEIGLTSRITGGPAAGFPHSSTTGSGSEEHINGIVVQSTFVQTTASKHT